MVLNAIFVLKETLAAWTNLKIGTVSPAPSYQCHAWVIAYNSQPLNIRIDTNGDVLARSLEGVNGQGDYRGTFVYYV